MSEHARCAGLPSGRGLPSGSDTHVNSIFFHKTELSMHSLWLPGGLAPPYRVISNGRKSLYERHTASTEAYSVKMAPVQCNNSIRSLTETPF